MSDARDHAAGAAFAVVRERLTTEHGLHAQTAASATGRLSGTFLIRSLELPAQVLTPGSPVFSDEADRLGPHLVDVLFTALGRLGVLVDPQVDGRGADLSLVRLSLQQSQELLYPPLAAIRDGLGLADRQMSEAVAVAAARVVHATSATLDPRVAVGFAVHGIVEGCKTVPYAARPPDGQRGRPGRGQG